MPPNFLSVAHRGAVSHSLLHFFERVLATYGAFFGESQSSGCKVVKRQGIIDLWSMRLELSESMTNDFEISSFLLEESRLHSIEAFHDLRLAAGRERLREKWFQSMN